MSADIRGRGPVLQFLGAAGTVTGSRFFVQAAGERTLVDCGLFQGLKRLRLRNWDPFPVSPATIGTVIVSHAHLDHSGYLPALWRNGFAGRVFGSAGTRALCKVVLPDSGRLQEEEAAYANRVGYTKHSPARALYTEEDALRALELVESRPFEEPIEIASGLRMSLRRAGHILGAGSVLVQADDRRLLFSGDLGRPSHPLLRAPEPRPPAEVVVVESTYGDRLHEDEVSLRAFEEAISRTAARGGVVLIPAFAVDRTEVVLFHLRRLQVAGRIPPLPVYVDSPMALAALHIYTAAIAAQSPEIRPELWGKPEVLEPELLTEVRSVQESKALNQLDGPMIIISASGMATGGRILHHLAARLPDPRNTVMLVGYQAEATRGHSLLTGASAVKMLGRYVPVRAEVVNVPAFSVHADRAELLDWLRSSAHEPETVYVVHGEIAAAQSLCGAIRSEIGWNAVVPRHLEQVRLA